MFTRTQGSYGQDQELRGSRPTSLHAVGLASHLVWRENVSLFLWSDIVSVTDVRRRCVLRFCTAVDERRSSSSCKATRSRFCVVLILRNSKLIPIRAKQVIRSVQSFVPLTFMKSRLIFICPKATRSRCDLKPQFFSRSFCQEQFFSTHNRLQVYFEPSS